MKPIYTLIALLSLSLASQARTPITLTTWWGNWSEGSSWNLNRVPRNGDSVIIPYGKGVVVNQNINLNDLYVKVSGVMAVEKKLALDNSSSIELPALGRIYAWNADRNVEILSIGGVNKFDRNSSMNIYGAGLANSRSGVSPNGFGFYSVLPVTFSSFYVSSNTAGNLISWSTANEFNNNNFEIERSADGSNWKTIAMMMGAGSTSTSSKYSYTDKGANGSVVYYRIRQVDIDGNSTYSSVRKISSTETTNAAKIYASNKQVNVEMNTAVEGTVSVRVMNTNGQVVAQQQFNNAGYKVSLAINNQPSSTYIVQVTDGRNLTATSKIFL